MSVEAHREVIRKVRSLAKEKDITIGEAQEELKIPKWKYQYALQKSSPDSYKNKRPAKRKYTKRPKMVTVELPDESLSHARTKAFLLVGSPDELAHIMRSLGGF